MTTENLTFLVSCDHKVERFRRNDLVVTVKVDSQGEGKADRYYVYIDGFGCSRSYSTPIFAITCMLQDHACFDIRAYPWPVNEPAPPRPEPDYQAELAAEEAAEHEAGIAVVKREPGSRGIRYVIVVDGSVAQAGPRRFDTARRADVIAMTWEKAKRIAVVDTLGVYPVIRIDGKAVRS
jgi:hypothetical protein